MMQRRYILPLIYQMYVSAIYVLSSHSDVFAVKAKSNYLNYISVNLSSCQIRSNILGHSQNTSRNSSDPFVELEKRRERNTRD